MTKKCAKQDLTPVDCKVTVAILLSILLIIAGNEIFQFKGDSYERWVNQLETPNVSIVTTALSSALDMSDPRVADLLRQLWVGKRDIVQNDLIETSLVKLELANSLFFLTDGHDEEYFDFIIDQLDSKDDAVRSYATTLLSLEPSNRSVNLIKNAILKKKVITSDEIFALVNISLYNTHALDVLKSLKKVAWINGTKFEARLNQGIEKAENLRNKYLNQNQ